MQNAQPPLQSQVSNLEPLTVTTGLVPLQAINVNAFQETMQKLGDPVPRPEGTDASAVLVDVFSRFLRHSEEPERSQQPLGMEGQPSRKSDSVLPSRNATSTSCAVLPDTIQAASFAHPVSLEATGTHLSSPLPPCHLTAGRGLS